MKRIILLIKFFILTVILHAQEKMNYELNGENIEFTISQEEMYVEFAPNQKSIIQRIERSEFKELSDKSAILKMTDLKGTYQERKLEMRSKISIGFQKVEPILTFRDGTKQIAKGEINIKLRAKSSLNEVFKSKDFIFQPNEFDKNLYLVIVNLETSELFKLVNQLQKDKRVEYIEPNFIRLIRPHTNDPFYTSQWTINNQGYFGGTVDADMDVDDAWAYTTGTGIKVAVIDEGVDLSHPDLTANLLSGYDATGNGSNGAPNENNNDGHGTACAGIIAAIANNSEGVVGISYNSKILPVRIGYSNGEPLGSPNRTWVTNDNWIANGINWAWQNGADVLSNSWGGGSPSSTISNAITNAVNNGRNGKGSVVLFSTGNNNGSVNYPATLENVISVGASSMCDVRKNPTSCDGEDWWGSNYGTKLDVVAPGVKIYTTDISGSAGYNSGNYKSDFNGTSSACPNAAGVVALILSANPNLSQQEAREILENNVDKVSGYIFSSTSGHPNGTWNSEVGYGRINARKAVEEAIGTVWMGIPQITVELEPFGTNYVAVHMVGSNGTNINQQGITSTTWQTISSSGGCSASFGGSGFEGLGHGNCNSWSVYAKITATNSFGTATIYRTITPPAPYPCDDYYKISKTSQSIYEVQQIIDPCAKTALNNQVETLQSNENVLMSVFDLYAIKVLESNNGQIDISSLRNGIYIIKANIDNEENLILKIIK